jgi:chaperonin GroES
VAKNKKTKAKAKPVKKSAAKKPAAKKAAAKKSSPKKVAAKPAKKTVAAKTSPTLKSTASKSTEKFQPLDDRVLVEPAGKADRTAGGIIIPDSVEDRPLQGKVLAVGRGHITKKGNLKPLDVKIGDEVLYGQFTGTEVQVSGRELLLLREEDILGVVR